MKKTWWEVYKWDMSFYFGLFDWKSGNIRLGVTLGWKDSSVDLLFCTFGFMR